MERIYIKDLKDRLLVKLYATNWDRTDTCKITQLFNRKELSDFIFEICELLFIEYKLNKITNNSFDDLLDLIPEPKLNIPFNQPIIPMLIELKNKDKYEKL